MLTEESLLDAMGLKIVDFKIYCAHYLVHNLSYAKTITDFEDDITTLEL